MKTYRGTRGPDGNTYVTVEIFPTRGMIPLNPRHDLRNHSPDGFEWGYGGSGPAQLALAILADHLGKEKALRLYQDFKWDVIAKLPNAAITMPKIDDSWKITTKEIDRWLEQHKKESK